MLENQQRKIIALFVVGQYQNGIEWHYILEEFIKNIVVFVTNILRMKHSYLHMFLTNMKVKSENLI